MGFVSGGAWHALQLRNPGSSCSSSRPRHPSWVRQPVATASTWVPVPKVLSIPGSLRSKSFFFSTLFRLVYFVALVENAPSKRNAALSRPPPACGKVEFMRHRRASGCAHPLLLTTRQVPTLKKLAQDVSKRLTHRGTHDRHAQSVRLSPHTSPVPPVMTLPVRSDFRLPIDWLSRAHARRSEPTRSLRVFSLKN